MFDLLREIGQTLRNNRLRTLLTGISVSWGIFMLIVLLGASNGVSRGFRSNVDTRPQNIITLWGGYTTMPYRGYKDGRVITLRSGDVDAIRADDPARMSEVTPYAEIDTAKVSSERDVITDGVQATGPRTVSLQNLEMTAGRFINGRDMADARRVIVLSAKNARLLFGTDDASLAVGKTVNSLGLAWTVIGIFDSEWRSQSYIPYPAYKAITGNTDEAYRLDVTVEGLQTEDDGNQAETDLRGVLGRRHNFNPADEGAVYVWNQFNSYLTNMAALGYLDLAVWVVGLFTLLTGIVGVSNIMFVSVRERTHEIGIRRAIGAKPRSILTQVLAESVAITTLFGYIGVVFGTIVMQVIASAFDEMKYATVDLSIALKVTLALIITGALAGLFPAMKAIKVKPVEALRDE